MTDKIIVSGHQRVRACKELGIKTVMCDVHTYSNDDEILQDLLETNIRQRGDVGGSAKKVGLRIKELERIYGIREGSAGKAEPKVSDGNVIYQSNIADMIGISVDTLNNYKKLTELVPELQDWVETGILAPTTALAIIRNLSDKSKDHQLFCRWSYCNRRNTVLAPYHRSYVSVINNRKGTDKV